MSWINNYPTLAYRRIILCIVSNTFSFPFLRLNFKIQFSPFYVTYEWLYIPPPFLLLFVCTKYVSRYDKMKCGCCCIFFILSLRMAFSRSSQTVTIVIACEVNVIMYATTLLCIWLYPTHWSVRSVSQIELQEKFTITCYNQFVMNHHTKW